MITCTVTGSRRYSADLEQGGLEIPCLLNLSSSFKEKEKAEKLVVTALESNTEKKDTEAVPTVEHSVDDTMDCTDGIEEERCKTPDGVKTPSLSAKSVAVLVADSDKFDFEEIIMGEMLSDIHHNAAQTILRGQFHKLNGFQSTLYQSKKIKWADEQTTNKVQIVHSQPLLLIV